MGEEAAMLKGVHPALTPRLLATLAEMGHGDAIAVVDRNFPAYAYGKRIVDLPGLDSTTVAGAVLSVLPVDTSAEPAAFHMLPADGQPEGIACGDFRARLREAESREVAITGLERFDFYRQAAAAYCVVSTGDDRPYACFLIVKGVVAAGSDT